MLDMYIHASNKHRRFMVGAMTRALDQRPHATRLRYPAVDTLLAPATLYNIVRAETTRYMRLTMRSHHYIELCVDLIHTMEIREYDMDKVWRQIKQAARSLPMYYADMSPGLAVKLTGTALRLRHLRGYNDPAGHRRDMRYIAGEIYRRRRRQQQQ